MADRPGVRDLFAEAEQHADFWQELAIMDFTDSVVDLMEDQNVSRAELARRLGTSRAYITRLLGGNTNFTLMTMVRVALALDSRVRVHLAQKGFQTKWLDHKAAWAAGQCEGLGQAALRLKGSGRMVTRVGGVPKREDMSTHGELTPVRRSHKEDGKDAATALAA